MKNIILTATLALATSASSQELPAKHNCVLTNASTDTVLESVNVDTIEDCRSRFNLLGLQALHFGDSIEDLRATFQHERDVNRIDMWLESESDSTLTTRERGSYNYLGGETAPS